MNLPRKLELAAELALNCVANTRGVALTDEQTAEVALRMRDADVKSVTIAELRSRLSRAL